MRLLVTLSVGFAVHLLGKLVETEAVKSVAEGNRPRLGTIALRNARVVALLLSATRRINDTFRITVAIKRIALEVVVVKETGAVPADVRRKGRAASIRGVDFKFVVFD